MASRSLSRRDFLATSASALVATAVDGPLGAAVAGEPPAERPPIILLMTDQHRGDALGCAGNRTVHTPHLDALARDGTRFTHAYSAVPSCTPARAGLLTGYAPWHHGLLGYGRIAERYPHEMPRLLSDAGYHSFAVGKLHFHPQRNLHGYAAARLDESGRVESPDFVSDYRRWFREQAPTLDPDATGIGWNDHRAAPYVLPEALHPTAWTGRTAVEFVEQYDRQEPMFLTVSFARPHSPYDPPKRCLDRYAEARVAGPVVGDWAGAFATRMEASDAPQGDYGRPHAIESRRHYYANISFIDEQVGLILDALRRRGLYDRALILFTSDHGDMLGDHHLWRKTYPYEASTRVPLLLKWPKGMTSEAPRGGHLDDVVELRDILPTMLDAAGRPTLPALDGSSLLTLVRHRFAPWRDSLGLEHATCYRPDNDWAAVTDGQWKFVFNFHTGEEQLFDLLNDPGECRNLVLTRDSATRAAEWRHRLVAELMPRGPAWVKEGALQRRETGVVYGPNYPGTRG